VKRLFLNELMASPGREISYQICLIIFVLEGIIHLLSRNGEEKCWGLSLQMVGVLVQGK
jgi:hypothetical protein